MTLSYLTIAKNVFDLELQHLNSLYGLLGSELENSIHTILNTTGKLVVSGIGKSGIIARKIASSFASIGMPSVFMSSGEAIHGDLGVIASGDTVLIISVGGNSFELSNIISYCKSLKVPIISIVGNKNSLLYKASNEALLLPNFTEVVLKVPSTSFAMTSLIGDALLACVAHARQVSLDQYKLYHPGGKIGSSLVKVSEIMRVGKNIPVIQKEALMSEALLEITSKALGCVVVVNTANEVLGVITDGDLRRHISGNFIEMRAEDVMSANPKTITENWFVMDALEYMNQKKITNLIVARSQVVVGVVHMHDCLKLGLEVSV